MKLKFVPTVILNALVLGAFLLPAGCGTTGRQRSNDTRNTMETVEKDYVHTLDRVDATGESLNNIVKENQPDENKAFKQYSENVDRMRDMEKKLFENAERMGAQQKNYFEEWRRSEEH